MYEARILELLILKSNNLKKIKIINNLKSHTLQINLNKLNL